MAGSRIYTVTQLNQEIKNLLESNPSFFNLFVQGEISNYKPHPSGHHYMTIKDAGAAIQAVMFRSDAAKLRFRLQNGMKVVARGRISSFPKSGQVQLYVADLMPDGAGALHIQFEQLKEKLYLEGLFDEARKRELPIFPEEIALVTSPSGAAVRDMLRILSQRWPVARVRLFPALVQGVSAPADLVRALQAANKHSNADVIILGRGGGSLEDLWAFNDERVARAIYASRIPVVSAVGHEPDVTISDFVADLRAPTPSGAAEQVVPDWEEVLRILTGMEHRMTTAFQRKQEQNMLRLDALEKRLAAHTPLRYLKDRERAIQELDKQLLRLSKNHVQNKSVSVDYLIQRVSNIMMQALAQKRSQLAQQSAALDALSPLKVLGRGYALASNEKGEIITDSERLNEGDPLNIRFASGSAVCEVCTINKARETINGE